MDCVESCRVGSQPTRFRMWMVARGLRTPPATTRAVPTPDGLSYTNCPWFVSEVEFCKMEIRLIFFKEIVGLISLKTELKYQYPMHLRAREEKSTRRFFLPKVSLISILQKFTQSLARDASLPETRTRSILMRPILTSTKGRPFLRPTVPKPVAVARNDRKLSPTLELM